MSDPDVADQLRNWRAECQDTILRLYPLVNRLHVLLPAAVIEVDFAPSTDGEIIAAIAEGLTPIDVVTVHVHAHFDLPGANWIADVIERGIERR
jgi:hypothetical protein